MAPRNRDKKNAHLAGTNIKKIVRGGKAYYYYVMPDGSLAALEHGDEKTSIEAAHILNQRLRPSGDVAERILSAPPRPSSKNPPVVEVLAIFQDEELPKKNYSEGSLKQRIMRINQYRKEWPHTRIGDLDTFTVAQFLRKLGNESARQHRVLLDQIFRFAASEGYRTARPMIDIEKKRQTRRKRARHTWEGHQAIYDACPDWLQRAIKIALYSLQRRSDLCSIMVDSVDLKARTIDVLQQKSRNYDNPVHIQINMGDDLFKAVHDCIWSGINCPYLIRHRPERITRTAMEAKPHPFCVTPDYLTRAYSAVRDEVGVYNHLPKAQRPGIHSLRALGIWLYTKAGYSDEYIMALAGHATERMKERYYEGHEQSAPVTVNADLSMDGLDLSAVNWKTDLSPSLLKLAEGGE